MNPETHNDSVNQLNSFLRGELSAVETYRQALSRLDESPRRQTLQACADSHERRARILAQEVRRLGGEPSTSSGLWGAFARLVEGGAGLFGEDAALSALEEGEDHGRDVYRRDIPGLERQARQFVEVYVLPEQVRTHDTIEMLKRSS